MHCDYFICSTHCRSQDSVHEDHVIRLFSKLMLEGSVGAVVHLVTKHAGGGVLDSDAMIQTGQCGSIPVNLPCCDALLLFEDVEISGLMLKQLLVGPRMVLVLEVVMLLIGMMFCFTMVLTVNI